MATFTTEIEFDIDGKLIAGRPATWDDPADPDEIEIQALTRIGVVRHTGFGWVTDWLILKPETLADILQALEAQTVTNDQMLDAIVEENR